MRRTTMIVAASSMLLIGCGPRPWNDFHQGLEVAAETLTDLDAELNAVAVVESDAAIDRVAEEARVAAEAHRVCLAAGRTDCGEAPTLAEYMTRYREQIVAWQRVTVAMDALRAALTAGESAATLWRDRREQPNNMNILCHDIADGYQDFVSAITPVLPEGRVTTIMQQVSVAIEPICAFLTNEATP